MQRLSGNALPPMKRGTAGEETPLLLLARRIRREQGAEQVKAFLAAMEPFSAPNEIKRIGEDFGIPYESIEAARARTRPAEVKRPQERSADGLGNLGMLMKLMPLLRGGAPDAASLMSLLGGMNERK
jgi:hypothetical protein